MSDQPSRAEVRALMQEGATMLAEVEQRIDDLDAEFGDYQTLRSGLLHARDSLEVMLTTYADAWGN